MMHSEDKNIIVVAVDDLVKISKKSKKSSEKSTRQSPSFTLTPYPQELLPPKKLPKFLKVMFFLKILSPELSKFHGNFANFRVIHQILL